MTKVHTEVVSVRMTPAMSSILEEVALTHNLVTLDKKPNLGAAARMLIASALDRGDSNLINETLKDNIRSELLQRVNAQTKIFIANLSEVMR